MLRSKAHKEKDPQDLRHLAHEFFFRNLSAVDCTLFSHFFSGHNMGTLPKTFAFDGCSVPGSTAALFPCGKIAAQEVPIAMSR